MTEVSRPRIRPRPINFNERIPVIWLNQKRPAGGYEVDAALEQFLRSAEAERARELVQLPNKASRLAGTNGRAPVRQPVAGPAAGRPSAAAAAPAAAPITVPSCREVADYEANEAALSEAAARQPSKLTSAASSALDGAGDHHASAYIIYQDVLRERRADASGGGADGQYDMDERDEQALTSINEQLRRQRLSSASEAGPSSRPQLTADSFEGLIAALELAHFAALKQRKDSWQAEVKNGRVPKLPPDSEVLPYDAAKAALKQPVQGQGGLLQPNHAVGLLPGGTLPRALYEHWLVRRKEAGGPLLQHLWYEQPWKAINFASHEPGCEGEIGDMPFMASETKNSRGGWNRLRIDKDDAYDMLWGVRGEMELLRTMADQVRKRERLKKHQLKLYRLEKLHQLGLPLPPHKHHLAAAPRPGQLLPGAPGRKGAAAGAGRASKQERPAKRQKVEETVAEEEEEAAPSLAKSIVRPGAEAATAAAVANLQRSIEVLAAKGPGRRGRRELEALGRGHGLAPPPVAPKVAQQQRKAPAGAAAAAAAAAALPAAAAARRPRGGSARRAAADEETNGVANGAASSASESEEVEDEEDQQASSSREASEQPGSSSSSDSSADGSDASDEGDEESSDASDDDGDGGGDAEAAEEGTADEEDEEGVATPSSSETSEEEDTADEEEEEEQPRRGTRHTGAGRAAGRQPQRATKEAARHTGPVPRRRSGRLAASSGSGSDLDRDDVDDDSAVPTDSANGSGSEREDGSGAAATAAARSRPGAHAKGPQKQQLHHLPLRNGLRNSTSQRGGAEPEAAGAPAPKRTRNADHAAARERERNKPLSDTLANRQPAKGVAAPKGATAARAAALPHKAPSLVTGVARPASAQQQGAAGGVSARQGGAHRQGVAAGAGASRQAHGGAVRQGQASVGTGRSSPAATGAPAPTNKRQGAAQPQQPEGQRSGGGGSGGAGGGGPSGPGGKRAVDVARKRALVQRQKQQPATSGAAAAKAHGSRVLAARGGVRKMPTRRMTLQDRIQHAIAASNERRAKGQQPAAKAAGARKDKGRRRR